MGGGRARRLDCPEQGRESRAVDHAPQRKSPRLASQHPADIKKHIRAVPGGDCREGRRVHASAVDPSAQCPRLRSKPSPSGSSPRECAERMILKAARRPRSPSPHSCRRSPRARNSAARLNADGPKTLRRAVTKGESDFVHGDGGPSGRKIMFACRRRAAQRQSSPICPGWRNDRPSPRLIEVMAPAHGPHTLPLIRNV